MKNFYLLILASLFSQQLKAQSQFYTMPVTVTDTYLEDSVHVLGRLDLDFPLDGKVFVQFDGEGFGDTLDRIILAANDKPDWEFSRSPDCFGRKQYAFLRIAEWQCDF